MVKNPPAVQEMQVGSLGWEDPLEEGMTTHFQYSYLGNPMSRGAWWATVEIGCKELDTTERLNTHTHIYAIYSLPIHLLMGINWVL